MNIKRVMPIEGLNNAPGDSKRPLAPATNAFDFAIEFLVCLGVAGVIRRGNVWRQVFCARLAVTNWRLTRHILVRICRLRRGALRKRRRCAKQGQQG
jgi:hypothetical protein